VVVRVDDPENIVDAASRVQRTGNQLSCVICDSVRPLSAITPAESWAGIPVALFVPEVGRLRDLTATIHRTRDLDVHVYLPAARPENLVSLRILASLNVPSCATFGAEPPDWEALADLMTYALLGPIPHVPIDPFEYIADHYAPDRWTQWDAVTFSDPRRYLHLDAESRVALSHDDLLAGAFIADDLGALDDIERHPAFVERAGRWRRFFAECTQCSCCPGWRVCQGMFVHTVERAPGCSAFFTELMDVVEQHNAKRRQTRQPNRWRP